MLHLCRLDELEENRARGFATGAGAEASVIVLRRGERVFGYRNVCPHRGTTLDWLPDQFMSHDGNYLQCATHGALFEPQSGQCVAGPCKGKQLTPVVLQVVDGTVLLEEEQKQKP